MQHGMLGGMGSGGSQGTQVQGPALSLFAYELLGESVHLLKLGLLLRLSRFSRVRLFATSRTIARQAPLSMGFSRQAYWSGLPCPPPGDLPDPGARPASLVSPALTGGFFTTSTTWEARTLVYLFVN